MKANEIKIGKTYLASVSGKLTQVRVDGIRKMETFRQERTVYDVTNLSTGRACCFKSAQKFRQEVTNGSTVKGRPTCKRCGVELHTPNWVEKGTCPGCTDALRIQSQNWNGTQKRVEAIESKYSTEEGATEAERQEAQDLVTRSMGGQHTAPKTQGEPVTESLAATGLGAKLAAKKTTHVNHLVVKAFAGTGKTFTLMTGTAKAFASDWRAVELGLCEEINRKNRFNGRPELDPEAFRITPSPEQAAIWDLFCASKGAKSVTYCAFNKSIVTEFSDSWGWLVSLLSQQGVNLQFATVNSLGNKAVAQAFGRLNVVDWRIENLVAKLLGKDPRELKRYEPEMLSATSQLVGLCKLNLTGWTEDGGFDAESITEADLDKLGAHYDIEMNGSREKVYGLIPRILAECLKASQHREIDFNDQNWLPVVLDLPIAKVDVICVDEGQDLPRVRQEFARRAGKRVIIVGDVNQAIYGFAGADTDSLPRMEALLGQAVGCDVGYLTETRRCGRAIVAEAQQYVPNFKAHETNPEGKISRVAKSKFLESVQDADMVLSRVNGPLVSFALKLIKAGRKAIIRGRKFGEGLKTFVTKLKAESVPDLAYKLGEWAQRETELEAGKRNPSEARLIAIQDKKECLEAFCENAEVIQDVIVNIDLVFSGKVCPKCGKRFAEESDRCNNPHCKQTSGEKDENGWPIGPKLMQPKGVLFSSVHRAKGLENNRVFLLKTKDAPIPHPMAKTPWQKGQERNLAYVAITRAIQELIYVVD